MSQYRVEILGAVPNGLTHNEVFATINSVIREDGRKVQSVTKRRLAGNHVSVQAIFEAESLDAATQVARYAQTSVFNFSADIIGPYLQK